MKILSTIFIILFCSSSFCYAAVTGTIQHGETVVITGSGFGSKTTAEPLIFDDFESGSADLSWTYNFTVLPYATIVSTNNHGISTKNIEGNIYIQKNLNFGWINGIGEKNKIYIYYWFKKHWTWPDNGDDAYGGNKVNRIEHVQEGDNPNIYFGYGHNDQLARCVEYGDAYGSPASVDFNRDVKLPDDTWVLIETYYEISDTTSGKMQFWFNGQLLLNVSGVDMACETMRGFGIGIANVREQNKQETDRVWYDDVYVDDTPARVMLCTNADGTGVREIQVASAWADGEITITFNQGGFPNGGKAYLCVWDSTNTLKSSDEVTIGSSGSSNGTTSQGIRIRSQFNNNGAILVH